MDTIREATFDDVEAISELLEQLQHPSSTAHLRRQLERIHASEFERVWVAEDSWAGVVGILALQIFPQFHQEPPTARIMDLCVRDGHRHRQFGRRLFEVAQRFAYRHGCGRIEVTANNSRRGAHQFYARNGFVQTHRYFSRSL